MFAVKSSISPGYRLDDVRLECYKNCKEMDRFPFLKCLKIESLGLSEATPWRIWIRVQQEFFVSLGSLKHFLHLHNLLGTDDEL